MFKRFTAVVLTAAVSLTAALPAQARYIYSGITTEGQKLYLDEHNFSAVGTTFGNYSMVFNYTIGNEQEHTQRSAYISNSACNKGYWLTILNGELIPIYPNSKGGNKMLKRMCELTKKYYEND